MSNPPLMISKSYLLQVQGALQDLETDVENQLKGDGTFVLYGSTLHIPAVDATNLTLEFRPGGPVGQSSGGFDIGAQLTNQLKLMGGSVNQELLWLKKVLTAMISEIGNTITQMGNADYLNSESVDQLISEFSATIQNLNNPPVPSGSTGG